MAGVAGGADGAPNRLRVRIGTPHEQEIACMANAVPHEAGEAFEYRYGGGGGWGDPLDRDPEAVRDDVLDELVSLESARRDYGVVLTGRIEDATLAVDAAATERLRGELRALRLSRAERAARTA